MKKFDEWNKRKKKISTDGTGRLDILDKSMFKNIQKAIRSMFRWLFVLVLLSEERRARRHLYHYDNKTNNYVNIHPVRVIWKRKEPICKGPPFTECDSHDTLDQSVKKGPPFSKLILQNLWRKTRRSEKWPTSLCKRLSIFWQGRNIIQPEQLL